MLSVTPLRKGYHGLEAVHGSGTDFPRSLSSLSNDSCFSFPPSCFLFINIHDSKNPGRVKERAGALGIKWNRRALHCSQVTAEPWPWFSYPTPAFMTSMTYVTKKFSAFKLFTSPPLLPLAFYQFWVGEELVILEGRLIPEQQCSTQLSPKVKTTPEPVSQHDPVTVP